MDTGIIAHALYARDNGTAFTTTDLNELLKLISDLTELTNDLVTKGLTQ
jgi:hypothetical protein